VLIDTGEFLSTYEEWHYFIGGVMTGVAVIGAITYAVVLDGKVNDRPRSGGFSCRR
jgi:hypothetical protein